MSVTRRNVLKGGAAAAALTAFRPNPARSVLDPVDIVVGRSPRWRTGMGPLYWSTYGYELDFTKLIPEDEWKANIDWVDATFKSFGYTMVCTDGWIDPTQVVNEHGYIEKPDDSWRHGWSWWAEELKKRGMKLGVYYNPLWVTRSAIEGRKAKVVGRPEVKVADIVNMDDPFDGTRGLLYWVDVTREGAEEYVKGYVSYFRELGAAMLRIDFLGWYEIGYDQNEGTVCMAHGREAYATALRWMSEAAGEMTLSLVLPNLFAHAEVERAFGDMIRIDNDATHGGWFFLSQGRQTWQPIWSQWNNPFMGFTGFSDVSGRGQLILDGDPTIISAFGTDAQRQAAVSLAIMAGGPIAIGDRHDTIGVNAHIFQNTEVLALRHQGLVGKPIYANGHLLDYDPTSRDPERWVGQLPDSSWVVGLFNRATQPATKSVDFAKELGVKGLARVRDLWAHQDMGERSTWEVTLGPRSCSLVKVSAPARAHYEAEVGAWSGTARFDNFFKGYEGFGYVTGLDTPGAAVTVCVQVASAGRYRLTCRVANATGSPATLTATAARPASGVVRSHERISVLSGPHWSTWQEVDVTLDLDRGDNLITLTHGVEDLGSVNVDNIALGNRSGGPARRAAGTAQA